jgi:hypothetical protein
VRHQHLQAEEQYTNDQTLLHRTEELTLSVLEEVLKPEPLPFALHGINQIKRHSTSLWNSALQLPTFEPPELAPEWGLNNYQPLVFEKEVNHLAADSGMNRMPKQMPKLSNARTVQMHNISNGTLKELKKVRTRYHTFYSALNSNNIYMS